MSTNENIQRAAGKAGARGTGYQNLFTIIKNEHDEVATLLEQTMKSDTRRSMRELFITLRRELLSHFEAEEQTLYNRLQSVASARTEVRENLQEHEQIRRLLEQLGNVSMGGENWQSILEDLKDTFDRHVEEEEDEIFALVQKVIDEHEAQQLGQRFQNEKNEAVARLGGPSAKA